MNLAASPTLDDFADWLRATREFDDRDVELMKAKWWHWIPEWNEFRASLGLPVEAMVAGEIGVCLR